MASNLKDHTHPMTTLDLVLGTVQLGDTYGIANRTGMPGEEDAIAIIRKAAAAGIGAIDTARGYGKSEERIGKALGSIDFKGDVITKLRPPEAFTEATSANQIESFVREEIELSRSLLKMETLDCVLLHRARHLTAWDGKIWSTLRDLVSEGQISKLGVSTQNVAETRLSLDTEGVSHIQLANNILDWRWRESGLDAEIGKRTDITLHVRSILLQGLLVAADPALFPVITENEARAVIEAEEALVSDLGRKSLTDLCVAYIRSLGWIDGLVIGMETMEQLRENLVLFACKPLSASECKQVEDRMPRMPEKLLNPGLWKK